MALSEDLRLLSIRVLQNYVRETGGEWNWEQWQRLIQRLRRMGFATVTEEHIRELCERNRGRWLSGDNSVEPAAPAEAETADVPLEAEPAEPAVAEGPAFAHEARFIDDQRLTGEMPAFAGAPLGETPPQESSGNAPAYPPEAADRREKSVAVKKPKKKKAKKKAAKKKAKKKKAAKKKARKKPTKRKGKKKKAKKKVSRKSKKKGK